MSCASEPAISPKRRAAFTSQVAAMPIGDGNAVAGAWGFVLPMPTPAGPLVITNMGIPSRTTAGTYRRMSKPNAATFKRILAFIFSNSTGSASP